MDWKLRSGKAVLSSLDLSIWLMKSLMFLAGRSKSRVPVRMFFQLLFLK